MSTAEFCPNNVSVGLVDVHEPQNLFSYAASDDGPL
jgi:hypothetical protein